MSEKEIVRYTRVSYFNREEGRGQIRIIGKWLSSKGFNPGDLIEVKIIKKGQISLTNVSYL